MRRAGRLFTEYREGNTSKMGDLVRMSTPILWHTVRASRLDSATAEDVLQTVWLALIRKADTITEPLAVLQWMVVTAKRGGVAGGSQPGKGAAGRHRREQADRRGHR